MASESRLHSHRQCSEPIRQPGRGSDRDRSADGVQQVPESRGHTSSDKAQHSPLQGNICNSYKHHFKTANRKQHQMSLLLSAHFCCFWQAYQYGVYTRELLQFGDKVSVLLLLPPSEDFSSSYWPLVGTKEPGLTMPLQIFELGRSSPEKKSEIMKQRLQCLKS